MTTEQQLVDDILAQYDLGNASAELLGALWNTTYLVTGQIASATTCASAARAFTD